MVRMTPQGDMSPEQSSGGNQLARFNANPLDIIKYLLNNWHWFLLTVALFAGYQWYQYSTTPCQYTSNATVMFKDARSNAQQAGLDRMIEAIASEN